MFAIRNSVVARVVLLGVLMTAGCSEPLNPTAADMSSGSGHRSTYRRVFDAWTKEGRIYDGLETRLISKVTFKSMAFREAYAAEYARLYGLEDAEFQKLLADQRTAADEYHDFIVAAYVPQPNWDDFSKEKSMWKIYLTRDNAEQIRPLEIRKLKKKNPVRAYFYPYGTTWKSVYQVRFSTTDPKTGLRLTQDPGGGFSLVMRSVIGSVEFKW